MLSSIAISLCVQCHAYRCACGFKAIFVDCGIILCIKTSIKTVFDAWNMLSMTLFVGISSLIT